MTAIEFPNALGKVNDKYIIEAINYVEENGTRKHPVQKIKRIVLIAAIVTAVMLLSAMAYAIIHYFSTAIENTKLYCLTGDNTIISEEQGVISPEDAAYKLAELFMRDLMIKDETRTYRVTEYKELSVTLHSTIEMDSETACIYALKESEISADTWIVEISVLYKYEGIMSPIGPSNHAWIDVLYQGSPIDFLLKRDGETYSLQSRYEPANS